MNLFPLNSFSSNIFSLSKENLKPFQHALQKKVACVVICIFASLAMVYCIYVFYKNRNSFQAKKEDKQINIKNNIQQQEIEKGLEKQQDKEEEAKEVKEDEVEDKPKNEGAKLQEKGEKSPLINGKVIEDQKQEPSNGWDVLRKVYEYAYLENKQEVELLYGDKYPIKMIASLLAHQQEIPFEELRAQILHLKDAKIPLDSYTRAALSLESPSFKIDSETALKEEHPLTLETWDSREWEQLISFLYKQDQAFLRLDNALNWMEKADQLGLLSLKNACLACLKNSLEALPYGEQDIQQVIVIFDRVKEKDQPEIKNFCENYFKLALSQPKEKINSGTFYRKIQNHPEIIELIFNKASKKWNSYKTSQEERELIRNHFIAILDHLHTLNQNPDMSNPIDKILIDEQAYINFVRKILEIINSKKFSRDESICKEILQSLSEVQTEELITTFLHRVEGTWDILIPLLSEVLTEERKERVLETFLPLLQDPGQLQRLYEPIGLNRTIIRFLSFEQIQILFQLWHAQLNEEQFIKKISTFLNRRINNHPSDQQLIERLLNENPWINIEKLMEANRESTFEGKHPIQPYLCGIYALRSLNGDGCLEEKIAKVHAAIGFTDPLKDVGCNDERVVLSSFLARQCPPAQLPTILFSYKSYNGTLQRMVESFLTTILASEDNERIQQAFTAYWTCFEELHIFLPRCEWVILPKIKTEEVLRAVYQSIPQDLPQEKKEEIKKLFQEGADYFNFGNWEHYQVGLPQEIVDRVLQEEMPN